MADDWEDFARAVDRGKTELIRRDKRAGVKHCPCCRNKERTLRIVVTRGRGGHVCRAECSSCGMFLME